MRPPAPSTPDPRADSRPEAGRLPLPDAAAQAHSEALVRHIQTQMAAAGGSLSFAHFMELALYAPGLGYYSAGARKLGAAGDFVTAPEISAVFSRCLARYCRTVLAALGGGDLLELGAGSGRMAADVLLELAALDALPGRYWILEPSPELRARQRDTLAARAPALAGRVHWLERMPTDLRGLILANEVLDAMPVQRFRIEPDHVAELRVVPGTDGAFQWQAVPAGAELAAAVDALVRALRQNDQPAWPPGYTSEIQLHYLPWLRTLADTLTAGEAVLIDYGYARHEYYHPQRAAGTLLCHYRHRVHDDPFVFVGLQDITASVDFTAVAEAALAAGFELAGFADQAQFLFANGLADIVAASDPADTRAHLALAQQIKTLTLPGEMGERCKALALRRGMAAAATGPADPWRGVDARHRL